MKDSEPENMWFEARVAIIGGIVSNVLAAINQCRLLVDTSARPIDVWQGGVLIAILTFAVVAQPAVSLMRVKERRPLGIAAILLTVAPVFIGRLLVK